MPSEPEPQRVRIVGIGASAGGLEALERFFEATPSETPLAFVVVQHLSPDHKSLMAEILGKKTTLPVAEAFDGQQILPGHVYLVPPRSNLFVENERLRFRDRAAAHTLNLPIDILFRSIAEQCGDRSIGIVLSGTGSDGRIGVEAIKSAGGFVLVQDPATARFDGMPLSAASTGVVDAVLSPELMPSELERFLTMGSSGLLATVDDGSDGIVRIHRALRLASGIDFSEYKPATIMRRIERRMGLFGVVVLDEYAHRLELDGAEAKLLAHDLLISVTRFFRDEESFEVLAKRVLPQLIAVASPPEPLRLWVPGCATGQEAYSLAMVLLEVIEATSPRVDFKIFATDVDRRALHTAAEGAYSASLLSEVPESRIERFFRPHGDGFVVERELRRRIVFAPHNVTRDPPFTRLDLISCRNLLIYLGAQLQQRVLSSFAFALKPEGYLMLGSSESLGDATSLFSPVDLRWKIHQRIPGAHSSMPAALSSLAPNPRVVSVAAPSINQQAVETAFRLLIDIVAPASVLVTDSLDVVSVFGNASELLRVPVGVVTLGLLAMLPSSIHMVVSLAVHRALAGRHEVSFAVSESDSTGIKSVKAIPFEVGLARRFVVLVFERSTRRPEGQPVAADALAHEARQHIAELERDLGFVRESLQATIEELETSNEELQATNEELLAANEELQSTNEELQSVNEELGAVNTEHLQKIRELTDLNNDLDNLFKSSSVGTLFLDDGLLIRRFSPAATTAFNLVERDVGRPIQHFSSNLEDVAFIPDVRRVLATGEQIEREVTAPTGLHYLMRLVPYLTSAREIRGVVATFVDVTRRRQAEERTRRVIDSLVEHVALLDANATIRMVNAAWERFALQNGAPPGCNAYVGQNYLASCESTPELKAGLTEVLEHRRASFSFEYPCHSPDRQRWFLLYVSPLEGEPGAVLSHIDITTRKLLELGELGGDDKLGPP